MGERLIGRTVPMNRYLDQMNAASLHMKWYETGLKAVGAKFGEGAMCDSVDLTYKQSEAFASWMSRNPFPAWARTHKKA